MDLRILLASFALVFLAELGDKTQLTALAFSSSSRSPWAVFLGTSLALVTASALAVAFGEVLSRVLPVKVLHISSAILFILMGVILLVNIARKAEFEDVNEGAGDAAALLDSTAVADSGNGPVFRLIVGQAAAFERELVEYLQSLAAQLPAGPEKEVLEEIIQVDRDHLAAVEQMGRDGVGDDDLNKPALSRDDLLQIHRRSPTPTAPLASARPLPSEQLQIDDRSKVLQIIQAALEAEENIADFYLSLARMARLPHVRDAFRTLALEDLEHARHLSSLLA